MTAYPGNAPTSKTFRRIVQSPHPASGTMSRSPQVGHRLDWIERGIGNFNEGRVPQSHRPVPETGLLVDERWDTGKDLSGDNRSVRNDKGLEIEGLAVRIAKRACNIDRVEMV